MKDDTDSKSDRWLSGYFRARFLFLGMPAGIALLLIWYAITYHPDDYFGRDNHEAVDDLIRISLAAGFATMVFLVAVVAITKAFIRRRRERS